MTIRFDCYIDEPNFHGYYTDFVAALLKKQSPELMKLHCALGCAGEAGELGDVVKREIIYERNVTSEGKSIKEGIIEECGDLFFYLIATLDQYDINFEDIIQHNYDKLGKRYKDLIYSNQAAGDRADKNQQEQASIPFTGNGVNK